MNLKALSSYQNYIVRGLNTSYIIYLIAILVIFLGIRQITEFYQVIFGKVLIQDSSIESVAIVDPQTIIDAHLMGKTDKVAILPTTLNIKLTGIVASRDEKDSYAVIIDDAGVEKVYHVGQLIMGATLEKIEPHRVILNLDGQAQVLKLTDMPHA